MQLFNQINARKIEDGEFNVFQGFFNNFLFLGVTILTFVVQMVMVENGGKAVKCFPLSNEQNMICMLYGAGELIWGLLIKFTPLKLYQCMSLDDTPLEEGTVTLASTLKKSSIRRPPSQQAREMKAKVAEDMKNRFAAQL
jgi:Ca2+ transporting ATPase